MNFLNVFCCKIIDVAIPLLDIKLPSNSVDLAMNMYASFGGECS